MKNIMLVLPFFMAFIFGVAAPLNSMGGNTHETIVIVHEPAIAATTDNYMIKAKNKKRPVAKQQQPKLAASTPKAVADHITGVVKSKRNFDIFDQNQAALMLSAHYVWGKIGYPETGQAILMQESFAGKPAGHKGKAFIVGDISGGVGKRAYGIMQMHLSAARDGLNHQPHLLQSYFGGRSVKEILDEELMATLMTDNYFSLEVSASYFDFIHDKIKLEEPDREWLRTVISWNGGTPLGLRINYPAKFQYAKDIMNSIKDIIRPFNEYYGVGISDSVAGALTESLTES